MINRITYIWTAATAALVLVMFYPLYVVFPGRYVDGWQSGSEGLGIALMILGGLIVFGGGFVSSHFAGGETRLKGMFRGLVGGAIAGLILFGFLGAGAAGTAAMGDILAHGSNHATDNTHFLSLTAFSVVKSTWFTYYALWGMTLAGAALGGLGGLIAPPAEAQAEEEVPGISVGIGLTMLLASVLSAVVAVAIFSLLAETTAKTISEGNLPSPPYSTAGILYWPAGTAMLMSVIGLAMVIIAIRKGQNAEDGIALRTSMVAAYLSAVIMLLLPVFFYFIMGSSFFHPTALFWNIIYLIGGVWSGKMGLDMTKRLKTLIPEDERIKMPPWALGLLLGYPAVIILIVYILSTLNLSLIISLLIIVAFPGYIVMIRWINTKTLNKKSASRMSSHLQAQLDGIKKGVFPVSLRFVAAMIIPSIFNGVVQTALSLVLGTVVAIVPLSHFEGSEMTTAVENFVPVEMVQSIFSTQAMAAGASLLVGLVAWGLSLGVMIMLLKSAVKQAASISEESGE